MSNNIVFIIFKHLNLIPYEEFKIRGETLTYRITNDLLVEFKHPIHCDWCIDKENYLSKLLIGKKIINK